MDFIHFDSARAFLNNDNTWKNKYLDEVNKPSSCKYYYKNSIFQSHFLSRKTHKI